MAKRKKKAKKKIHWISMLTLLLFLVTLCTKIYNRREELSHKYDLYQAKEEALLKEQEFQERRQEVLQRFATYVNSFQFIEDTARDKFGLVYPNEFVIKADKDNN